MLYYVAVYESIVQINSLRKRRERDETLDSGKLYANYLHGILTLILFDKPEERWERKRGGGVTRLLKFNLSSFPRTEMCQSALLN